VLFTTEVIYVIAKIHCYFNILWLQWNCAKNI